MVDVCCVQETKWRCTSVRLITRKDSEYKMFWVGNNFGLGGVRIAAARKKINMIFDLKCVKEG